MEQTNNQPAQLLKERTREEIEDLKKQWANDGCWDLEDTEGFEAHRDELKAFADEEREKYKKRTVEAERLSRQIRPHDAFFPFQKWYHSDYTNSALPDEALPGASIRTQIAAGIMASLAGGYAAKRSFSFPETEPLAIQAVALTDALIKALNE